MPIVIFFSFGPEYQTPEFVVLVLFSGINRRLWQAGENKSAFDFRQRTKTLGLAMLRQ
jgi:hypothetical protein